MARFSAVLQFVRTLVADKDKGEVTDCQLLHRFTAGHEEDAFAALVQRHGPLVWGVCQRVLHHAQDAEDAFQATFLVLARRAKSIAKPHLLGNWLYGVAYRTALAARRRRAKRRETQGPSNVPAVEPTPETVWADLRPILDAEVNRLPEKYRIPLVLCYLEGLTYQEAAHLIGCPHGTVMSRLAWAREQLRSRLTRRGLAPSVGLLATVLAPNTLQAAMPDSLSTSTTRVALSFLDETATVASASVIALAKGGIHAMLLSKIRLLVVLVLVLGLVGTGAGVLSYRLGAANPPQDGPAPQKKDNEGTTQKEGVNRTDQREESAKRIKELQKEQIATLKKMVNQATVQFQSGRISYEPVMEARLLLLKAELDAAEKEADRITVLKNFVEAMKQGETLAKAIFESGQGTELAVLSFRARRLDAEIQLERAKTK